MHWVNWGEVTKPKELGGLGLQSTKGRNMAFLAKLNWRFQTEKDSLAVQYTMGYESGSPSQEGRDEDDEEEYEEGGGGNRFLGFMFGNVDNSGDLDVDYLDEDAKEHLAALADKLGPSLTDIDLSERSPRTPADTTEQGDVVCLEKLSHAVFDVLSGAAQFRRYQVKFIMKVPKAVVPKVPNHVMSVCDEIPFTNHRDEEVDYDEKAEDAVDYEDFDEQYEGPEIQATSEEDHLLPKKEYFSTEVSLASLKPTSVFDDENYDEELEQEHEVVDNNLEVQTTSLTGDLGEILGVVSESEESFDDDLQHASLEAEKLAVDIEEFQQEEPQSQEESLDGKGSTPLPVLCVEDGMVICRFSEIFGIHEPLKKGEKRDRRFSIPKGIWMYNMISSSSF
ncbi:transcription initiation factor tfiid subunit 1 [Quercus suber]|uniref:Transcription initiation factor tfiid subunit 1 n=1 Tax=Quercus suber TaxID=58331 RepID=A0AAW0KD10_QUESU